MKTGKALPHSERMAPAVGFEPTTNRLTADRSTTELRWIAFGECGAYSCVAIRAGQALLWGQKKTARAAFVRKNWLRGLDLNQRPSGYEPDELPGCSTPRVENRFDVDAAQIEKSVRDEWSRLSFAPLRLR